MEIKSKHFGWGKNGRWIARLSKKSPTRFLWEKQKKMTSQNVPQSTISQSLGVIETPQKHSLTVLKGFSTVSAAFETIGLTFLLGTTALNFGGQDLIWLEVSKFYG